MVLINKWALYFQNLGGIRGGLLLVWIPNLVSVEKMVKNVILYKKGVEGGGGFALGNTHKQYTRRGLHYAKNSNFGFTAQCEIGRALLGYKNTLALLGLKLNE